jgi:hypothetical protein
VAVAERLGRGVRVGDTELVGLAFGVGVDVAAGGAVVWAGAGEDCPVVAGLPTVAACGGLTST